MKKVKIFLCLITMCSLLTGVNVLAAQDATVNKVVDKQAPDFTLKNINGDTFHFKDHRGKPVLLNFTTTWCPYCKEELPEFKEMYNTYKGKLEIVAIYVNESPYRVQKYVQRNKIPYTVLVDPLSEAAQDYFVMGVPTRVLVSADGEILCYRCRSFDSMLQKALNPPKK